MHLSSGETSGSAGKDLYEKGQLLFRIISSGLLAVVLLATGAFLAAEGQTMGETTTHIATLLAVAGMGVFLYFGLLIHGYMKTYRMPV